MESGFLPEYAPWADRVARGKISAGIEGRNSSVTDLKTSQLTRHFLADLLIAFPVEMEPSTEFFGIQSEYLADPTKASRMIFIGEKPFQGVVAPDFPFLFLVGRLLWRDDISKGLKQNSQGQIPKGGIWLFGLRIEAFAFDY